MSTQFESFEALNEALSSCFLTETARKSQRLIDAANNVVSQAKQVASAYASLYAQVQWMKYDEDGVPDDVTPDPQVTAARSVLASAKQVILEQLDVAQNSSLPETTIRVSRSSEVRVGDYYFRLSAGRLTPSDSSTDSFELIDAPLFQYDMQGNLNFEVYNGQSTTTFTKRLSAFRIYPLITAGTLSQLIVLVGQDNDPVWASVTFNGRCQAIAVSAADQPIITNPRVSQWATLEPLQAANGGVQVVIDALAAFNPYFQYLTVTFAQGQVTGIRAVDTQYNQNAPAAVEQIPALQLQDFLEGAVSLTEAINNL